MGIKRHKPEEIVTKLRQVEVLCGQGMPRIDAIRHDRYRHDDAKGSVVSPCSFRKDELVQRQVRHGATQPIILLLKPFELLQLVGTHTAILLSPAIKCLLSYLHLPDRINARHPLPAQHLNLPQLRDNLFRLVSLDSHI